jgi:hypothetical protein
MLMTRGRARVVLGLRLGLGLEVVLFLGLVYG